MIASSAAMYGQSITAAMYNYSGGNQISCHGLSDGSITTTTTGGATPYAYLWSNSATSANLTGIAAGTYTVTVTDANAATATVSATLLEPAVLSSSLSDVKNHGYDISCKFGNDGAITNTVNGGTPSYSYVWNVLASTQNLSSLIAGTYTVTVTDANGCTATGSITLTEPTIISNSLSSPTLASGFNTNCNVHDGAVNLTVSGGVTGYTFSWNSGQTTQNISALAGGLYAVVITDQNGCTKQNSISVSTPPLISTVNDSATVYLNNANESCDTCHDGIIKALPVGGTAPYTYQWAPGGATPQTITGLYAIVSGASVQYSVTVTDAAGCSKDLRNITLLPAGSNDWTITGNHGNTGFIGTLDSADFVVKTNGTERMRIGANGKIKLNNLAFSDTAQNTYKLLALGPDARIVPLPTVYAFPCSTCSVAVDGPCIFPATWYLPDAEHPEDLVNCPSNGHVGIGINYPQSKLDIISNGNTSDSTALRIRNSSSDPLLLVRDDGTVGIGISNPNTLYKLDVAGIIHTCEVLVDNTTCPDYVFDKDYKLTSLKDLDNYIKKNHHLPDIPSAKIISSNGMNLGEMNNSLLRKVEEQTLYIINLQKQIDELKVAIKQINK